jgi:hypothetical protein
MNLSALLAASTLALAVSPCAAQVTTSQYNNSRTAATLHEKILTPQNVNAQQFGKLGAFKVNGAVYAQPLYVPAVPIPGKGTHDVLYVATEHDSVYAFDANRPSDPPLWKVSFLDKSRGVTTLSEDVVDCPFIRPEVGITSTPVIDLKTGTLYVLARTMIAHKVGDDEYFHHLHALAITTGVEKFGGPKLITASVPGKGAGASKGQVAFDALRENPRAALTLVNSTVYLEWASSCDVDPYHGWVMSYDAQTLAQKSVLNVNPDGMQAGIWLSDTGPAVDAEGNLYVPTGNGTFDAANGGRDYGDSVLKLDGSSLAIRDYFTPHDQQRISEADTDVGSSGPTLVPDQPGPHPHLLLQPTKDSTIYVIDRDNMGKYHPESDALIQMIRSPGPAWARSPTSTATPSSPPATIFSETTPLKTVASRCTPHHARSSLIPAQPLPSPPMATRMLSSGPSPPKPGTAPIPNTRSFTPSTQPSWANRSTTPNKTANATARPWLPGLLSRS